MSHQKACQKRVWIYGYVRGTHWPGHPAFRPPATTCKSVDTLSFTGIAKLKNNFKREQLVIH